MRYANVIINVKTRQLDKLFTYAIPPELRGNILAGHRIVVPFGKGQYADGVVWSVFAEKPDFTVKAIVEKLDDAYRLSETQLNIMRILRKYYAATYQEAFQSVLPSVQKLDKIIVYSIAKQFDGYQVDQIIANAELLSKYKQAEITKKIKAGFLKKQFKFDFKHKNKIIEIVRPLFDNVEQALAKIAPRAVKKRRIIKHMAYLKQLPLRDLTRATRATRRDITALLESGFLTIEQQVENYAISSYHEIKSKRTFRSLSDDQNSVVQDYLALDAPRAALLNGVTGSGKTRVYIELAKQAIERGKQVLVLVPEISLTPQLVTRFADQLTTDIGVIHTYIRPVDKINIYQRIKSGDIKVVIGARSAIFAPFKQLGLIVIDEEHEYSYKSETIPRYHTVELALQLARKMSIDIVLGSATPSLKTHHLVDIGQLKALYLKRAFGPAALSDITIVDMTKLPQGVLFSSHLIDAMKQCFERREQIILFHNRKGYSRAKQCHSCGYVHMCQNCAVPLTVYDGGNQFVCHYCGYREPQLFKCPTCGDALIDIGYGIEQIKQQLDVVFPTKKFVVVDSDLTHNHAKYIETLAAFKAADIDVLIGTQILAKGLDFANVTLVGVIMADQLIHMPDYLSSENAYQLLTQVAGRAGRGAKSGKALIQTYQPEHPLFDYVIKRDFDSFVKEEKHMRDIVGFPPYVTLFTLKIQSENKLAAHQQAQRLYNFYEKNFKRNYIAAQVFQPIQPYYARIRQRYRAQVLFKVKKDSRSAVLTMLYYGIVQNKYNLVDSRCWVDIDFDG